MISPLAAWLGGFLLVQSDPMDRSAPHPRHMRILQRVEARQTAQWRDLLHSGRSPHPWSKAGDATTPPSRIAR